MVSYGPGSTTVQRNQISSLFLFYFGLRVISKWLVKITPNYTQIGTGLNQIFIICRQFHVRSGIKIWADSVKGLGSDIARCRGRKSSMFYLFFCYQQHCAQRIAPVFRLLKEAILKFFASQRRQVSPIGVKFGIEESVDSYTPNFTQISTGVWVCGPKTEDFTKRLAYKRPAGAYPLGNFYQISSFVRSFMFGQILKFGRIRSRGFAVLGV